MSAPLVSFETQNRRTIIGIWLFVVCAMVFAMIVLGGVTRLTHSGLSMVDWKPATGWLPPIGAAEWEAEFTKYKTSPEFTKVNSWMTVDDFKSIFWFEFIHRLWGRVIGVAFFIPMVFFLLRGWVDKPLGWRLAGMFVLGGLQGVLGWYMVKSGLVDRPDVSQYRLTAHLGAALVVLAFMFWTALGLVAPLRDAASPPGLRRALAFLPWIVLITILSGGFVAGTDAGFAYSTFPLMDGALWPDDIYGMTPWWLASFEHIGTVQFHHRVLAELTFLFVTVLALLLRGAPLDGRAQRAIQVLVAVTVLQVILGISTLLLVVPVSLAALHQAVAVVLFAAALWAAYEFRPAGADAPY